jgi:hypothetical protein
MNAKISDSILVIKRDGSTEPLNIEKIHQQVLWATEGISGVSSSELEIKSQLQFYNGIKTTDIQETLIKAAADLIELEAPNYQYVAARLINHHIRKEVYDSFEPLTLLTHVKNVVAAKFYTNELLEWYNEEEFAVLDTYIDHERDMDLTYAAMEQWRGKYLVKNRVTSKIFETPQMAYMLIAATLFHNYPKNTRLKYVKEYYDAISQHVISLPTPVMSGVRTPRKQFSSCVLIEADDSVDSVLGAVPHAIARYIANKAGIGVNFGRIRALGSIIRDGDSYHTGVVPFVRHLQTAVKSCLTPDTIVEIINDNDTKTKIKLKDLKVGDRIKSYCPATHDIVFNEVKNIWDTIVSPEDQVQLSFSDGSTINCSKNHPVMVNHNGKTVDVLPEDLLPEHEVITDHGVVYLKDIIVGCNNDTKYIDISVDNSELFFAQQKENQSMILVHNCNQGGVRGGAATGFFPFWHLEFEDLVVLKNNKGTEDNRARHLDYAVQFNKLAYERLLTGGNITLFSPSDVPGLYEAFFNDQELFKKLYEQAETNPKIRKKTLKAIDLFTTFMQERKNTGRIYFMNVDHANTHSSFIESEAPVHQSNLCVTGDSMISIKYSDDTIKELPIDSFVEQWDHGTMVGVKVKSYDTTTGEFVWSPVTAAAKTNTVSELIEIEDSSSGNIIRCTPEHEIWTKTRGWVMAKDLLESDVLCTDI